jgi:hypothetical protein
MIDLAWSTEVWQTVIAAPLAVAGAIGAFVVRRRPRLLLRVLLALAVLTAIVGAIAFGLARSTSMSTIELRELFIATKFAVVFSLVLLLGASGLSPTRNGPPAA